MQEQSKGFSQRELVVMSLLSVPERREVQERTVGEQERIFRPAPYVFRGQWDCPTVWEGSARPLL